MNKSKELKEHKVLIRKSNSTLNSFKVYRNKLCPCGSGKKYKNCHLQEVDRKNPFHQVGKKDGSYILNDTNK